MRIPPTKILLTWPTPNYVDPPTQGVSLIVVNIIFMALITIAVPLRVWGRWKKHRKMGADDILIVIAYIFSMGLGIVVILANAKFQWNRHLWDVEFTMFARASMMALAAKVVFTLAATFTRASLICFYFRLVKDTGLQTFYWVLWGSMAYNIAVGITFVLLAVFLCNPVQSYWVFPTMPGSTCLDEGPVTLIAGVLNCVSDLMVTFLPIPIVLGLNMPLRQRIGVTFLLSLGFIVTIAGVVRTYYIWKTLMGTYDETWDSMPLYICATLEIDLAVLCACAPALKPILAPFFSSVTEMISTVVHHGSHGGSRLTGPKVPTVSRSVTVSHQQSERGQPRGDKIPITLVSVQRSVSEEDDYYDPEYLPTAPPKNYPRRSTSRSSSQGTILANYGDNSYSVAAEYDVEAAEIEPEHDDIQSHHFEPPPKRPGMWDTDWRVSKGLRAGWI